MSEARLVEPVEMAAFLVRMVADKEIVGFFSASSISDLSIMVDDCTVDPALCEYKRIEHGGVYWHKSGTPIWDVDNNQVDLSGASAHGFEHPMSESKGWKKLPRS